MSRANYYHYHSHLTRSQALRLSWAEWKQVSFIPKHNFGALNQPEHKRPSRLLPTHYYHQTPVPYTAALKPFASGLFLTILLFIFGLVVLFGLHVNQGNFVPDYKPPQIYFQEWK